MATKAAPSHPLFDTVDPVNMIRVERFEASGKVMHPRAFAPEELDDETKLFAMFGGGLYDLIAYGRKVDKDGKERSCIVDRKRVNLAGAPKALVPEPATASAAGAPVQVISGGSDLVNLMSVMMNAQQANQSMMMQLIGAMQKSTTDILVAVLGTKSNGSDAATAALAELAKAALGRPPAEGPQLSQDKLFDLAHRLGKAEGELEASDEPEDEEEEDGLGIEKILGGLSAAREMFGGVGGKGGAPGGSGLN